MPELPDVEIFKQYLTSTSLHKEIRSVEVLTSEVLEGVSDRKLKARLKGAEFMSARRHGKYLFAETAEGKEWLVLHFGMTGFLKYFKGHDKDPPHERFLVSFTNGFHLAYDSQRKLGEIGLVDTPERFIKERQLGPDALDPTLERDRFAEIFRNTRAAIKSALMNQKHIAGIGNIYSDEILFQSGIHPEIRSGELGENELNRLYSQMKYVLESAIEARADPDRFPSTFIIPHRHGDGICPKCKTDIEKRTIGGRTAYYCPHCQKR